MTRAAEPRSNFPRACTPQDWEWDLDCDEFRRLCFAAMTASQEEYFGWHGLSGHNMADAGVDWCAELDDAGYWIAVLQDDGETIALAEDWREASEHEHRRGPSCCFMVRLIDSNEENTK